ncbi:uncharacterized protein LOC125529776 [Triticum urartu]|uniref:uncharacterized protein LOC125529776 n=1 Tax=Triticum urartu TaxID=4572 RepID=UPI00204488AF|nr:uncharacterized protein LOC125529776 [Triticum urartu]
MAVRRRCGRGREITWALGTILAVVGVLVALKETDCSSLSLQCVTFFFFCVPAAGEPDFGPSLVWPSPTTSLSVHPRPHLCAAYTPKETSVALKKTSLRCFGSPSHRRRLPGDPARRRQRPALVLPRLLQLGRAATTASSLPASPPCLRQALLGTPPRLLRRIPSPWHLLGSGQGNMSGNPAGVDNTFRRKFDKEEYLERARQRERDEKDEARRGKDRGPPVQRQPLKHRDYEVDLESRLGKTQVCKII